MGPFSKQEKKLLREIVRQRVDDVEHTAYEETGKDAADLFNHVTELKTLLKKIK